MPNSRFNLECKANYVDIIGSAVLLEPDVEVYQFEECCDEIEFLSLTKANSNSIVFVEKFDDRQIGKLSRSTPRIVVCAKCEQHRYHQAFDLEFQTVLFSANPKRLFAMLLDLLCCRDLKASTTQIHPSAIVDQEARLHDRVVVGQNCVLGNCEIGEGTEIRPGAIIGDGVKIGAGSYVGENSVIGCDGFGLVDQISTLR